MVLYALPELDGAIDTVPLGGLVGDDIFLIPERVDRLAERLHHWIDLRRTHNAHKRVAIALYGFPPNVGAAGTAALLNVPKSLMKLLRAMKDEGYDVGGFGRGQREGEQGEEGKEGEEGEALLDVLRAMADPAAAARGAEALNAAHWEAMAALGGRPAAAEVDEATLRGWLRFPSSWGPTEWGPMPSLPAPAVLLDRLEKQWGRLGQAQHIGISTEGKYVVSNPPPTHVRRRFASRFPSLPFPPSPSLSLPLPPPPSLPLPLPSSPFLSPLSPLSPLSFSH